MNLYLAFLESKILIPLSLRVSLNSYEIQSYISYFEYFRICITTRKIS